VRRNEEIVRADHCSTRFERRADLDIVKCCFVRKRQHFDVPQVLFEGNMILLPPGRDFYPNSSSDFVMTEMQTHRLESLAMFSEQSHESAHDVRRKYLYRACTLSSEFALL